MAAHSTGQTLAEDVGAEGGQGIIVHRGKNEVADCTGGRSQHGASSTTSSSIGHSTTNVSCVAWVKVAEPEVDLPVTIIL